MDESVEKIIKTKKEVIQLLETNTKNIDNSLRKIIE